MAEVETSSSSLLEIDEFYLSVLFDEEKIFPISDEKYAEELQLQEALMSSVIASQMAVGPSKIKENPTEELKQVKKEAGESSKSYCEICMEGKPKEEMMIRNNKCPHSFCSDCVSKHVASKIQDNISMVTCPGLNCEVVLEPHICRSIITDQVFDQWENALCESLILETEKFYCPFDDCSAMLVADGVEVVRESECPNCHRLFCAQCKVPWHSEMGCEDFQRLNEDERGREDLMVVALAKQQKWMRCPNCYFFVEKTDGCLHITCSCKFQFCYGCGSTWTQTHGGCQGA